MDMIKIGGQEYEATITLTFNDIAWNNRMSKSITLNMESSIAAQLFVNGVQWSIISGIGAQRQEYDNSEFEVAGTITDNRDGSITVKMGKKTELEKTSELMEILLGEEA